MNRRYPEMPMVGIGAIIFRDDRVLLIKRGNSPALGKWSIPGGLVELGETLETAVRREVLEEVGLDVKVLDLCAALDRVILDDGGRIEYHYVLLDFLCEAPADGNPVAATDAEECLFIPLSELSSYELTRGTEKVVRRAFEQAKEKKNGVYDTIV
jgi:8-oxo-dGTP diphosphatase